MLRTCSIPVHLGCPIIKNCLHRIYHRFFTVSGEFHHSVTSLRPFSEISLIHTRCLGIGAWTSDSRRLSLWSTGSASDGTGFCGKQDTQYGLLCPCQAQALLSSLIWIPALGRNCDLSPPFWHGSSICHIWSIDMICIHEGLISWVSCYSPCRGRSSRTRDLRRHRSDQSSWSTCSFDSLFCPTVFCLSRNEWKILACLASCLVFNQFI